jgi:hypothetical protein
MKAETVNAGQRYMRVAHLGSGMLQAVHGRNDFVIIEGFWMCTKTTWVAWGKILALRGYSTHLDEQKSPHQDVSRNRCLLRYGWVFKKVAYWEEWKKLLEPVCKELELPKVSVFPVWKVLHEQSLYSYHIRWAQALAPSDHRADVVFCQWLPTKCVVNTQFVRNILIIDEAGFTRGGIVNFHATHVWMDDSPHVITASRHQHQFSINIWVGILGDQLLGPVVLYAAAVRSCLVWGCVVFLCSGFQELIWDILYGINANSEIYV